MSQHAFAYALDVRWGDLDAFNHVNNTVFLRYVEEARIRYFADLGLPLDEADSGPVVAQVTCSFRRAITYPARVRISVDAHCASERRLLMRHRLTDADDEGCLYADAEVTVVWVDARTGRAIALPAAVTRAVAPGGGAGRAQ